MKYSIDNNPKEYEENPFIKELKLQRGVKINKLRSSGKIDEDGKKLVYSKQIAYDATKSVKVYDDEVCLWDILPTLSKAAIKVLCHIMKRRLRKNDDRVVTSPKDFCDATGYKNLTDASRGLKELVKKSILAHSNIRNMYWVNVQLFYDGNRIYLLKEREAKENGE